MLHWIHLFINHHACALFILGGLSIIAFLFVWAACCVASDGDDAMEAHFATYNEVMSEQNKAA